MLYYIKFDEKMQAYYNLKSNKKNIYILDTLLL